MPCTPQRRTSAVTRHLPLLSLLLLQETLRGRKRGSPWPAGLRTPAAAPRRGGAESTRTHTPIRTDAAGSIAPTRSRWPTRLIPIRSLRKPARPSLSFATSTAGCRRAFHFSSCWAPSWSSSTPPVSTRRTVPAFEHPWTGRHGFRSRCLFFRFVCWGRPPHQLSVCQQKYPDTSLSTGMSETKHNKLFCFDLCVNKDSFSNNWNRLD